MLGKWWKFVLRGVKLVPVGSISGTALEKKARRKDGLPFPDKYHNLGRRGIGLHYS